MFSLSLIAGIFLVIQAKGKGYNPWLWFWAASLIGYAVLSFLPSTAKIMGRDPEEMKTQRRKGNIIGAVLSIITISFEITVFLMIYLNSISRSADL